MSTRLREKRPQKYRPASSTTAPKTTQMKRRRVRPADRKTRKATRMAAMETHRTGEASRPAPTSVSCTILNCGRPFTTTAVPPLTESGRTEKRAGRRNRRLERELRAVSDSLSTSTPARMRISSSPVHLARYHRVPRL